MHFTKEECIDTYIKKPTENRMEGIERKKKILMQEKMPEKADDEQIVQIKSAEEVSLFLLSLCHFYESMHLFAIGKEILVLKCLKTVSITSTVNLLL